MNPEATTEWLGGRLAALRGSRIQKGDIGAIILRVLKEKPMYGYEIIRTLEERSQGFWRPSAGSVYPTLQLLEEQGHLTSSEAQGKKVYALTNAGHAKVEADTALCGDWKHHRTAGSYFKDMGTLLHGMAKSMKGIALEGTEDQMKQARTILVNAERNLSALAEELPPISTKQ